MQSIGLEFLKNSHVSNGGRISPYGTLCFHSDSCERGEACSGGRDIWSREFLNHGRVGHRVHIGPDGIVTIIDRGGEVVSIVEREDIAAVYWERLMVVDSSQYLLSTEYSSECEKEALLCAD